MGSSGIAYRQRIWNVARELIALYEKAAAKT